MKIDLVEAVIGTVVSLAIVVAGGSATTLMTVTDGPSDMNPIEISSPYVEDQPALGITPKAEHHVNPPAITPVPYETITLEQMEREMEKIKAEKAEIEVQQREILERLELLDRRLDSGQ